MIELLAFPRIRYGVFEGCPGNSKRLRRDAETAAVKRSHGNFESFIHFPQNIVTGNEALIKEDFCCR